MPLAADPPLRRDARELASPQAQPGTAEGVDHRHELARALRRLVRRERRVGRGATSLGQHARGFFEEDDAIAPLPAPQRDPPARRREIVESGEAGRAHELDECGLSTAMRLPVERVHRALSEERRHDATWNGAPALKLRRVVEQLGGLAAVDAHGLAAEDACRERIAAQPFATAWR